MLRHERRLLTYCLLIGAALTVLVLLIGSAGLLAPLENWLYDMRARTCQVFTPEPTDKLVHFNVDDRAIDVIGGMPWPRARWAQILDEFHLAGAKAVEMDVIFSEPQAVQYQKQPDGSFIEIDNDQQLAAAVQRLGNVILPVSLEPVPQPTALYAAMLEELRKDLELEEPQLEHRLRERGIEVERSALSARFLDARREAMTDRFADLPAQSDLTFPEVRARLLPRVHPSVTSGVVRVLEEQWQKYLAGREFRRFALPTPPGMMAFFDSRFHMVPLRRLSEVAGGGAFVDYPHFDGPVIRSVPLLTQHGKTVFPQLGLALACKMLGGDMRAMRIENRELKIPRAGTAEPDIVIPLAPPRLSVEGRKVTNLMNLPWFGTRDWQTMYDWPRHQESKQHASVAQVWAVCVLREKIAHNNAIADEASRGILQLLDPSQLERFNKSLPPLDDFGARVAGIKGILTDAAPYAAEFAAGSPQDIPPEWATFLPSVRALEQVMELTPSMLDELQAARAELKRVVEDKAVLIGWIATAVLADFVPTSLHEKCPGVVVHGVVYNGIMTGEMWRAAPRWCSAAAAVVMGLITAFAAGRFPPLRAMLVAALLTAAFALINGLLLFDYGNRIVDAAAPLMVVAVVWSACTLTRVVVETAERARITRRFSNYADPKLVSYVLEHPEVSFDGEVRDMTVVFSDLVGFTSLSESLGEKIVPVLNELLGELVPVIRDHHHGYVNKFLGDGIMFFYNAPMRNDRHASDAVATVLDMHATLARFNGRLRERGLPELAMRAGIASGDMIVGDAGGAGRNDYTVLGDVVNLAARLEPANKVLGTHTMMNARTAEVLDGSFLVRRIARLNVVGKDETVTVFEPVCRADAATPQQRMLVECTREVVDCFIAARFSDCLSAIDRMEQALGPAKLTAMYRGLCERYLRELPGDGFDGRIVLTEK